MGCPTCGLDNDPSSAVCARCDTALDSVPSPRQPFEPAPQRGYRRPSRHLLPLLTGLSVLALIVVSAGVIVTRGGQPDPPAAGPAPTTAPIRSPSAPPVATPTATRSATAVAPADPRAQAETVDALLDRSGRSRAKLNRAIDRVDRCTDVRGALADLRAVGDEREAQINEVRDADLSALPDGEAVRSALVTALRHALDADRAYVDWAEPAAAGSCRTTATRRAAFTRGRSASDRAGAAKQAFLARWNPVATELGLPSRTRQEI